MDANDKAPGQLDLSWLEKLKKGYAREPELECKPDNVTLDDFHAYMPQHAYIFVPTRALWSAISVNARIAPVPLLDPNGKPLLDNKGKPVKISAAAWLDRNRSVELMTWAPGKPELITGRFIDESGWIERAGIRCFNTYRPPTLVPGDAAGAARWLEHTRWVYPDSAEADHIIKWCAHRVQRPAEKVNHALVLGGHQGIGKDTILEPVTRAIGPWNFQEESPRTILDSRFNGYKKSIIFRISEARDLGAAERHTLYNHTKTLITAPPATLRVNEKYIKEYYIPNVCGVIFTTNYRDGLTLEPDDRRHYCVWSPRQKEDPRLAGSYFKDLYAYFDNGGDRDVMAYLLQVDLIGFDPKAPPPQTSFWWELVNSSRAPEAAELTDILDKLEWPDAVTVARIRSNASTSSFGEWLDDRRNQRIIPHRMEDCGYIAVRNPDAKDGIWKIAGRRQTSTPKPALTSSSSLRRHGRLATRQTASDFAIDQDIQVTKVMVRPLSSTACPVRALCGKYEGTSRDRF